MSRAGAVAGLGREARRAGLMAVLCLSALALVLQWLAGLAVHFTAVVLLAFAPVLLVLGRPLRDHHPHPRLGDANRVTLARAALTALLAGVVLTDGLVAPTWWLLCLATVAAVADGVDGRLARRQGTSSAFGARFDMEVDAAFVLVLSVLVWQLDRAGVWVLASGLMRYLFVAGACLWPWLGGRLPASRRRQTVCVLQVVALIVCLGPPLTPGWTALTAAAGLAALLLSFGIDIVWLARHAPRPPPERSA